MDVATKNLACLHCGSLLSSLALLGAVPGIAEQRECNTGKVFVSHIFWALCEPARPRRMNTGRDTTIPGVHDWRLTSRGRLHDIQKPLNEGPQDTDGQTSPSGMTQETPLFTGPCQQCLTQNMKMCRDAPFPEPGFLANPLKCMQVQPNRSSLNQRHKLLLFFCYQKLADSPSLI